MNAPHHLDDDALGPSADHNDDAPSDAGPDDEEAFDFDAKMRAYAAHHQIDRAGGAALSPSRSALTPSTTASPVRARGLTPSASAPTADPAARRRDAIRPAPPSTASTSTPRPLPPLPTMTPSEAATATPATPAPFDITQLRGKPAHEVAERARSNRIVDQPLPKRDVAAGLAGAFNDAVRAAARDASSPEISTRAPRRGRARGRNPQLDDPLERRRLLWNATAAMVALALVSVGYRAATAPGPIPVAATLEEFPCTELLRVERELICVVDEGRLSVTPPEQIARRVVTASRAAVEDGFEGLWLLTTSGTPYFIPDQTAIPSAALAVAPPARDRP